MIRVLKLSIPFFAAIFISSVAVAFVPLMLTPTTCPGKTQVKITETSPFAGMTIREFLALTPRKYRELTGKRLSLPQKLSLKHAQYRVRKMYSKNKQVDLILVAQDVDTNNFNILGFILGIALGPLGILIAFLIEGKSSSTFRWALYGSLIWLGIFLLVVLVL